MTVSKKVEMKCDYCGKVYSGYRRSKNFTFCSIECRRLGGKIVASGFTPERRKELSLQFTEMNKNLLCKPEYVEKSRLTKKQKYSTDSYTKHYGKHEHRVVMERILGRKLESHEIVHHKDGNKRNNNPENLEVMTQSEHARLHFTKKGGGSTL